MELKERRIQTTIKHEVLKDYLRKWGPIITNGINTQYLQNPNKSREKVRFMYIDYFSFMGAYLQDGLVVDGSPLIGIRSLDALKSDFELITGSTATTSVLLFEKTRKTFNMLLSVLDGAGFGHRIKRIDHQETLGDGDIGVACGDSSRYVDRILTFIDRVPKTYSFHFIDPYGIKSVERVNIERITAKKGADCIITMMLNTVTRFMVAALTADVDATEAAYAVHFDKFFGPNEWRIIARNVQMGAVTRQDAQLQLSQLYYATLKGADKSLRVKQIPLNFEGQNQLLYHLFLTTHNAYGSLAMNEILADAKIRDYDYRENRRELERGQTSLFAAYPDSDPDRPTEAKPNLDFLAEEIYTICRRKSMTYSEVLNALADTTAYFEKDMRGALTRLKTSGRALFDNGASGLSSRSKVVFP